MTATTISRDEDIMALLENVKGMIFNFARRANLEFEDCLQEAYVIAMTVAVPSNCSDVAPYLCACIRNGLTKMPGCNKSVFADSLDKPRGENDWTLYDCIADESNAPKQERNYEELY